MVLNEYSKYKKHKSQAFKVKECDAFRLHKFNEINSKINQLKRGSNSGASPNPL